MKKTQKGMFIALLAGSLMFTTEAHADLQSAQQRVQDLQSSLNSTDQQINQTQQQQQALQNQADQLQQTIDQVKQQISQNQQEITAKTNEVNDLNGKIAQNEQQLKKLQDAFNTQIRTLYEHGDVSYLSVLLDSTSFDDFLNRFDDITLIADTNKKLEDQMKQIKAQLAQQKQQVQSDLADTQKKQTELSTLAETDQALQAQQQSQANALQSKVDAAQQQKSEVQSQLDWAQQELQNAQQHPIAETNAASSGATATLSGSVGGLIGYAEQFLGTPYVWGGTQPGGFDCSGYTSYVFSHFGIPMNRTAAGQFSQGVATSNPQPGDLVFFSTYGPGATHVGIYVGGGMFVNAEDSGVKVSSLSNPYWGPRYIGARHIINN